MIVETFMSQNSSLRLPRLLSLFSVNWLQGESKLFSHTSVCWNLSADKLFVEATEATIVVQCQLASGTIEIVQSHKRLLEPVS